MNPRKGLLDHKGRLVPVVEMEDRNMRVILHGRAYAADNAHPLRLIVGPQVDADIDAGVAMQRSFRIRAI